MRVLQGNGLTFTIGRGNDICCMAILAMLHLVVGADLDEVRAAPGRFWRTSPATASYAGSARKRA